MKFILARVRTLFRRNAVADDIHEEMQFHLDMRAADLRQQGLDADTARRTASRRFGNLAVMQDRGYHARGGGVMETVMQDVRYAIRLAARQPRFSALVVLTVALAMGVSTTLFSVIDAAILRPIPFANPDEIVDIGVEARMEGRVFMPSGAVSDMRRWKNAGVLSAAAAWRDPNAGFVLNTERPEHVAGREVSEGYLQLHGVSPALGRDFTTADTTPAAAQVVMVSHAYWRSRLAADPNAIGRVIRYDAMTAELVGVVPAGFYPRITLWRPLRPDVTDFDRRGAGVHVYGRLRPGVTVADAESHLPAVTPVGSGVRATGVPASALGAHVRVSSVLESTVANYQTIVRSLAGAVGVIVLIACVNVAGLLLARGATRETELAIRASMGAGRVRLLRQLLVESVTLSIAGGLVGILVAWVAHDALLAVLPIALPQGVAATLNWRVLATCGALTVVTGLGFGLAPALRLSRAGAAATARGARRWTSALSRRGGQSLIAIEVALAVVLVVAAGLMIRSFARLSGVDVGFDPSSVVAFKILPVEADAGVHARYFSDAVRAMRSVPGVEIAGAVDHFALGETGVVQMARAGDRTEGFSIHQILPGYFEAMRVRLLQGRLPSLEDMDANRPVAVLNESGARSLFAGGTALGQELTVSGRTLGVIGIVGDFRHGPPEGASSAVFVPFDPARSAKRAIGMTFVVRPRGSIPNLPATLRRTAEGLGARVLVDDPRSGSDWFSDRVATPRHQTTLVGLLATFGLALALVGIFSTTAYAVARRTREIGVRMALGARPADVVRGMVHDAGRPVACGLAAGLAGAYYATRAIQALLFEIAPRDLATFVSVPIVIAVVAIAAAWIPARRAARVDPVMALRAE